MKNRASVAFLLKVSLVCSCLTYLPNRVIASSTTEFTSLEIIETSSTTTQSPASTSVEEVVGGWKLCPTQDEDFEQIVDYAFQTATEGESVDGSVAVTSIRNVMCQVVAGINYKFTMDLEWTAKGYDNERLVQKRTCEQTVYSQPWTGYMRFLESPNCQ